jgi:hypothetical protein
MTEKPICEGYTTAMLRQRGFHGLVVACKINGEIAFIARVKTTKVENRLEAYQPIAPAFFLFELRSVN